MNRVVKLAQSEASADGAGVWLFTNNEIFHCAGAGDASNDERLRLALISKVLTSFQPTKKSRSHLDKPAAIDTVYDVGRAPSCARSLLVEPIFQGDDIAGALAVCSTELNAFTERDATNLRLLADVLAQALGKAEEAGLEQSVALEPAALRQLIEGMIPALQNMLGSDESSSYATHGFPKSEPEPKRSAGGLNTKPLQELHESSQVARLAEAMGRTWTEQPSVSQREDSTRSTMPDERIVPRMGVPATPVSEVVKPSNLWRRVCEKSDRVGIFVRNCASGTYKDLILAGSWFSNRVVRSKRRPAAMPREIALRDLRHPEYSILSASKSAKSQLQKLFQSRPSRRTIHRTAPVLAVLLIMIGLMVRKARHHGPAETIVSRTQTTAPEKTLPLRVGNPAYDETARSDSVATGIAVEAQVAEPIGATAPVQGSHMHVTDRLTENAKRTLSHYELAGLRRRALYGDDERSSRARVICPP